MSTSRNGQSEQDQSRRGLSLGKSPLIDRLAAVMGFGIAVSLVLPSVFFLAGIRDAHFYGLTAVWLCAGVTMVPAVWSFGPFAKRYPVAATLMTTTWRISAIAGIALIATATKWPEYNLFSMCLVGCYFLFIVLESCLSIRKLSLSRR
jgi:hypothetical protein